MKSKRRLAVQQYCWLLYHAKAAWKAGKKKLLLKEQDILRVSRELEQLIELARSAKTNEEIDEVATGVVTLFRSIDSNIGDKLARYKEFQPRRLRLAIPDFDENMVEIFANTLVEFQEEIISLLESRVDDEKTKKKSLESRYEDKIKME